MPINLTTLAGKLVHTEVEFYGHKSRVTYDPMKLTAEGINDSQKGDEEFAQFFSSLVKSWDVKRGTKPVPLTKAALLSIPLPLLQVIFRTIMSESGEGVKEEGKASSAT